MKEHKYPQVSVIVADGPEELQQKINAELKQHPDVTKMTMPEGNCFRAVIQYDTTETVPEDEGERYYLETGKRYCCNDCPECIWDPDRRAVTHWCQFHKDRVRLKSSACDEFINRLRSGDVHPVTAEERNARYNEMDQLQTDRRKEERQHATRMYQLKKKEAKYQQEILKAVRELREEETRLNDETRPLYSFEMLDVYHPLNLDSWHSNEVNILVNGSREELTEDELIDIAKELNATLIRCGDMQMIDDETLVWHDCVELYVSADDK